MKKWISMLVVVTVFLSMMLTPAMASAEKGPAPNSGDCVPDGSGFDGANGSNGSGNSPGPAPNSGDGVPDGSGF